MKKFDEWLLDNVFQPIVNFSEQVFELDLFFLSRCSITINAITTFISGKFFLPIEICSFMIFFGGMLDVYTLEKLYNPKFVNPYREWRYFPRLFSLIFVGLNLIKIDLFTLSTIFFMFTCYFLSCNKAPPSYKEYKLSEFLS